MPVEEGCALGQSAHPQEDKKLTPECKAMYCSPLRNTAVRKKKKLAQLHSMFSAEVDVHSGTVSHGQVTAHRLEHRWITLQEALF